MLQWITDITDSLSYWGVALLMFLENIFPPIPSEVVMPAAGFAARQGELSFFGVIVAGTLGSLAGTLPWYLAGRWIGEERLYAWIDKHGKWIAVNLRETKRAVKWFHRWGYATVLCLRMVPGLRTLISVPAGFAEMPFWKFLLFSAIGTTGWNLLLAWLGWLVRDNYHVIGQYIGWISAAIIASIVLWWVARLAKRRGWFGTREKSASAS